MDGFKCCFNSYSIQYVQIYRYKTLHILHARTARSCASRLLVQERILQLSLGHILRSEKEVQEGIGVLSR